MNKSIEIQAPNAMPKRVFLAGSIEMGTAEEWQKKLIKDLDEKKYTFFNPRRDDWDSSWEQTIKNQQFHEQVTWELNALEDADIIVLYFDPKTKSPISLVEFGLHAKDKKMIVCCPKGFWKKGNVDIVCERFNIPLAETIDELISDWDYLIRKMNG